MLKQYGPEVPEDILRRLVKAFSELRLKADEGTIQYPYSTREVVNIGADHVISTGRRITNLLSNFERLF